MTSESGNLLFYKGLCDFLRGDFEAQMGLKLLFFDFLRNICSFYTSNYVELRQRN